MNKTELIAAVAEQAELSKKDAEKALKAFTDVIAAELVKGEKVQLVGFVHSRYPRERLEREETRLQARRSRSQLPRTRNSKHGKALKEYG